MATYDGILRDLFFDPAVGATGREGRYGLETAGGVEQIVLGALTRETRTLLYHRGRADGVVARLEPGPGVSRREVLVESPEGLSVDGVHAAYVIGYSVGMEGIDGVQVRLVGAPIVAYLPGQEVFSRWFPDAPRARGVAREELLELFGARVEVVVMNPDAARCVVGRV